MDNALRLAAAIGVASFTLLATASQAFAHDAESRRGYPAHPHSHDGREHHWDGHHDMMEGGHMMGHGSGYGMMGRGSMMGPDAGPRGMGGGMMMGPNSAYDGGGMMMGPNAGPRGMEGGMGGGMMRPLRSDLTADDVTHMLQHELEWMGNPNLKLGKVEETSEGVIIAEIVTQDDSLVQRLAIDPHTGQTQPAN